MSPSVTTCKSVTIKPAWVTTAVYRIINSPLLASCGSVLKLNLLDKILAPTGKDDTVYPRDKHRYILHGTITR